MSCTLQSKDLPKRLRDSRFPLPKAARRCVLILLGRIALGQTREDSPFGVEASFINNPHSRRVGSRNDRDTISLLSVWQCTHSYFSLTPLVTGSAPEIKVCSLFSSTVSG